jgi:nicotinate-nucleotide adenylyltransferase
VKLGILGGTFDPPHLGHLIVAQDAWSALGLDRILFVPAGLPPHKLDARLTSAELRLAMVRAAIAGDDRFDVNELELRRQGPSYTVDTLRELRAGLPRAELYLLLGADQVREFQTWRDPAEIARLAHIVALSRTGELVSPEPATAARVLPVTRIDVSATGIRTRVAAGEPIRYLVPAAVEAIIRREGLYRARE